MNGVQQVDDGRDSSDTLESVVSRHECPISESGSAGNCGYRLRLPGRVHLAQNPEVTWLLGQADKKDSVKIQTQEIKNVWRPGRDSARVTKEAMQWITCV